MSITGYSLCRDRFIASLWQLRTVEDVETMYQNFQECRLGRGRDKSVSTKGLLHSICSLCYNPIGRMKEKKDRWGYKDESETQSHCLGTIGVDGTARLNYRHPNSSWCHLRKFSGWHTSYKPFYIIVRATAWPDLRNIWSVPFI